MTVSCYTASCVLTNAGPGYVEQLTQTFSPVAGRAGSHQLGESDSVGAFSLCSDTQGLHENGLAQWFTTLYKILTNTISMLF